MLECGARRGAGGPADVPELQLIGYPPEDLVLKPEFVRRTMECAERLVDATRSRARRC
jgi:NAD+ synthase